MTTLPVAVTTLLGVATPAAGSSSACSHDWHGAQVCVRLDGANGWNPVTEIWTNPPAGVRARGMYLYWNGQRFGDPVTARRVGRTLSCTWQNLQSGTDTELCVT